MKTVAITLVLALVAVELSLGTRMVIKSRVRALEVLRGLRLRHFLLAVPTLFLVVVAALTLIQIPGLDWGWWNALGGSGNVILGVNSDARFAFVPFVFLAILVVAMPALVESEERTYRLGAESWSLGRRAWRSLVFGLVHLIVGIPIGVALALALLGGYYTWMYVRTFKRSMRIYREAGGANVDYVPPSWDRQFALLRIREHLLGTDRARETALLESTRAHLVYNYLVLAIFLIVHVTGSS